MGIISGIVNVFSGAAKALTPKQESPSPEPVQIMVVDSKQKTHKEQVRDWINGEGAPDKINKIHDNISNVYRRFESPIDGEPESIKGMERIRTREQRIMISDHQSQSKKFNLPFGSRQSRDNVKRKKKRDFDKNEKRSSKKGRGSQKNYWKRTVGKWRL